MHLTTHASRSSLAVLGPQKLGIARDNRAFFMSVMAPEASSGGLADAVFAALVQPHEYEVVRDPYRARVVVKAAGLNRGMQSFVDDLARAICHFALRIGDDAIDGDLKDRVVVEDGKFRFDLRITGYWAGKFPDDGITEDPTELWTLPPGEMLSRRVELAVEHCDAEGD